MKGHLKVLSCPPCRERKVRCDRLTPCKSCIRHGCEAYCRPYDKSREDRVSSALPLPIPRLVTTDTRPPGNGSHTALPFQSQDTRTLTDSMPHSMAEDLIGDNLQARLGGDGNVAYPQGLSSSSSSRACLWRDTSTDNGPAPTVESLHDHIKLQTLRGSNCDCQQAPTVSSFGARLSVPEKNAWKIYLANQLPTRSQCDLLVAFFFRSINWTYQSIHGPSFRRQQQIFWSAPVTEIDVMWLALLYVIMCLSALHIDPSACAALDMDASRIRGTAHHWFRLSRQALHAGEYEAKPCLTQLQVFIESQVYWYAVKGVDSLNSALAQAVRCAQALGLDRDYEPSLNLQAEIRHRVWWDICCADTFQSLCLDRQPLVQSYLSRVPVPLNCDDSGLTETSVSPLPMQEPTCSSYRVVLTQAYKVLNRLFAEDGTHLTSYEWISAVDAELVSIIDQLPWYMNMSSDKAFAKSRHISGYDYIKWQHHILQNTISMQRLRMHRPFLQTGMRDLCWAKCIDAVEKSFSVYLAIRASYVKKIIHSKKMLVQSFQSFCSVVSVAMFLLIERPKLPQNLQHDIETAIQDLRDLAEANPSLPMAAEGRATLNRLLSAYRAGFHGHNAGAGSLEGVSGQALIQDLYEMMGGGLNTRKYLDKDQNTSSDYAYPGPNSGRHDYGTRSNTSYEASAFNPDMSTEIMALSADDSLTLADTYIFPLDNPRNLDMGLHFDVLNWAIEDFDFPAQN